MDDGEDAAAQRAAEQARLRKAKREAKLKEGGAVRLSKISGVNGSFREAEPPSSQKSGPERPPKESPSEHFHEPARRLGAEHRDITPSAADSQTLVNDFLAQMVLSGLGGTAPGGTPPPVDRQGAADAQDPSAAAVEDPFLKMLLSQLGGMAGAGAGATAGQNALAAVLQQTQKGQQNNNAAPQGKGASAASRSLYIWRAVHALFAFALGISIFVCTTFSFTRLEREQDEALASGSRVSADADAADWASARETEREWLARIFWFWAASEAALLAGRFLAVDNGGGGGALAMVSGAMGMFLPPVVVGTLRVVVRYSRWVFAIRQDLAVVVFVLGISAWVRSGG